VLPKSKSKTVLMSLRRSDTITDYEKFLEDMKEKDAKLPSDGPKISIGMKDEKGSLLILGGHKAKLWQLKTGLYAVAGEVTADASKAIELYNQYNNTKLASDYIWMVFEPWYKKQYKIIATVPSSRDPNLKYNITQGPNGEILCDPRCKGFRHYGHCWHTDMIKELINA